MAQVSGVGPTGQGCRSCQAEGNCRNYPASFDSSGTIEKPFGLKEPRSGCLCLTDSLGSTWLRTSHSLISRLVLVCSCEVVSPCSSGAMIKQAKIDETYALQTSKEDWHSIT